LGFKRVSLNKLSELISKVVGYTELWDLNVEGVSIWNKSIKIVVVA